MIACRDAQPGDADALDEMARRVWLATFGHSAPAQDIRAYVDAAYGPQGALRRHLADPAYDFHVAIADAALVGYGKVGPTFLTDEADTTGLVHLHQLYVDPAQHGAGVGDALLGWAKDLARRRDAAGLILTVWEENHRARRFYDRHGFVHVGDYAFRTGDQIDRDLIMRLTL